MSHPHLHEINIYYEDTDLTGAVYHANYLAYFERAREHCLGVEELVRMYQEDGIGFVVHHANITYRAPSGHGDTLQIETVGRCESDYRVIFTHKLRAKSELSYRVEGEVTLVCVDRSNQLVPIPSNIQLDVARLWPVANGS